MGTIKKSLQFTLSTPGSDELYLDADCSFWYQPEERDTGTAESLEIETCDLILPGKEQRVIDLMRVLPKDYLRHIEEDALDDIQYERSKGEVA